MAEMTDKPTPLVGSDLEDRPDFSAASQDTSGAMSPFLTPTQMMLIRFRQNKLAVIGFVTLILLYLSVVFASFFGPYDPLNRFSKHLYLPPRNIYLRDGQGNWHFPFVYAVKLETDRQTFTRTFVEDRSTRYPVRFLIQGDSYKILGLWTLDWHLFGVEDPETIGPLFLLGGDKFGRDLFSRILYGGRISLSIGLVGVALSLFIGLLLGGLSGLYGGAIDNFIQRIIEFIRSIPTIPLWMGFAAALPADWPMLQTYFAITVILSFLGWTTLARVIRGKFLSLRNEDFVLAARSAGASDWYLSRRRNHLSPAKRDGPNRCRQPD